MEYVNCSGSVPCCLHHSYINIPEAKPSKSSWWITATLSSCVISFRNCFACWNVISGIVVSVVCGF